jgi:hypothetical protein
MVAPSTVFSIRDPGDFFGQETIERVQAKDYLTIKLDSEDNSPLTYIRFGFSFLTLLNMQYDENIPGMS